MLAPRKVKYENHKKVNKGMSVRGSMWRLVHLA